MADVVKLGQVWRDADPRMGGRMVTVLDVRDGAVYVVSDKGRRSRVSLAAFSRRYVLICD